MTDKEKLIELFVESAAMDYKDSAEYFIANGVTFQKWIPVTERLPECDQVVLCYKADRGVRTGKHLAATYADGVSAFKDCCRDYAFGATHWMPLPQPPKGE